MGSRCRDERRESFNIIFSPSRSPLSTHSFHIFHSSFNINIFSLHNDQSNASPSTSPNKNPFSPSFHLKFLPQPTSKPYHLRSIRGGANPTTRWSARSLELSATRLPCPRRLLAHSPAPELPLLPIYRLRRESLAQAAAGAAHRLSGFIPAAACVRGLPPATGAASRLSAALVAVPDRLRVPGLVAACPTLLCK